MTKFFTIFKFTYLQNLKRKGFLVITLIGMVLMAVLFNMNKITESLSDSSGKVIVFFDEYNVLNIQDDMIKTLNDSKYTFKVEKDKNNAISIKDDVKNGKSDYYGFVEISMDNDKLKNSFYVKTLTDGELANKIDAFINNNLFYKKALSLNLSQEKYRDLLEGTKLDVVQNQEITEDKFMLVYGLILALYGVILYYGSVVANSVIEEKSNRIMETLITMATPLELFSGKVLGICALGLTQMLIFVSWGAALYKFCGVNLKALSSIKLTNNTIVIFIICFLLGYLIYSLIYGALGSLVSSAQDSTAALLPMTLILMIVFIVAMNCIGSIDTTMTKVLSYIPISSPIVMFERLMITEVSTVELILSGGISIITICVIGIFSSKVYKRGVLHYGKKLSIFRAIRSRG